MSRIWRPFLSIPSLLWFLGVAPACQEAENDLLSLSPPPRLAAETPALSHARHLVPSPESQIDIALRGPGSQAQLRLGRLHGTLTLHPLQLGQLRGELRASLRDLKVIDGPVVLTTLLAGMGLAQDSAASRSDRRAVARFTIREVLSATPAALHLAKVRVIDGKRVGEARVVVRGELELAGIRSEMETALKLSFPVDANGPDLARLELSSATPVALPLETHGLLPPKPESRGPDEPPAAYFRTAHASLSLPLLATEH